MSQLISYVRNLFHGNPIQERKRRNNDVASEGLSQFPKYRRVSNVFPKQYTHRADDEIDAFQLVKQNRHYYNDILENFAMEQKHQQRKQFQAINDEEFSDEEDLSSIRVPNLIAINPQPNGPSTSGFNFTRNRQGPSAGGQSTFKFSQSRFAHRDDDEIRFMAATRKFEPKPPPRNMPDLLPILQGGKTQASHEHASNGFDSSRRRSIFDFIHKNRAFSNSSKGKLPQSVIDRNHNLEVKQKYDNLIKTQVPIESQKFQQHRFDIDKRTQQLEEHIQTIDLSSEETEPRASGITRLSPPSLHFSTFSKPKRVSGFVDLSDDESEHFFARDPVLSSTINKKVNESSSSISNQRRSDVSLPVPEVTPVNSLKERQNSRLCLQDDAISSIVKRYNESHKQKDSQIIDAQRSIAQLTLETAQHERQQQQRIDQTVTSLRQCIILDEEEEVIDEYPQLTDHQLQIIKYALHGGSRGEVLASKFSMNITRSDLNTLDGLNWLNDEVINFYMELIKSRSEEVDHLPKVHVMNTFFMGKLLQMGHSGVRRWTRKVDIFSCDIIPVPIHVGNVHWCMSIINMRDKTIRYYDSMGHANMAVCDALEQYLRDESMDKRKIQFDTSDWTIESVLDCPQQRNGSDCGVFSCMFAEFLSRDGKVSFDQQHMQYFRRKMVFEIMAGKLLLGY